MTTLVAWIGIDSRKPSSIYLASDSRISWDDGQKWDYGRKIFTSSMTPDILGSYGDVLFPSQVLGQIIELIEKGLLFNESDSGKIKHQKIFGLLKIYFSDYPKEQHRGFTVIYCTRENSGMDSIFHVSTMSWNPKIAEWNENFLDLPERSGIIASFGSGGKFIEKWHERWDNTKEKGTSRIVFGAFCDSLFNSDDSRSGGAPQLAGLYRKGNGQTFGIIYENERFVFGLPASETEKLSSLEWRNTIFERCDWQTKEPLPQAQKHLRPRGLGKA